MKISSKALAIAISSLFLFGCSVKLGYPINYERLSKELSNYEIGQSSFNPNDPLLQNRIILVSGGVNKAMSKTVCRQLVYLDQQSSTEPIKLLINSDGGDCTVYQNITHIINSIDAPVDTVNVGVCASMGALLIQSATGKRYAVKDTIFLIHEPRGTPKEIKAMYKELQEKVFITCCNLPEKWIPLGDKNHIFSTNDALEYQFVDEVIDSIDF